ncbi:MAG: hypothetical protein BJ554DRAFT_7352 [Olpidium bornovanus]|uniref:Uncharacterized protein n=1 Tax=Olpidium bornovanus TaxID=278681 RepID=A0A8H8DJB9_9FUNG|nr:MAG: hypothetical protein BJ554DRAFT_7352 [Olpidium bornovanus]
MRRSNKPDGFVLFRSERIGYGRGFWVVCVALNVEVFALGKKKGVTKPKHFEQVDGVAARDSGGQR